MTTMEEITNEQVIIAFSESVREQLMTGEPVVVPGLGAFDVRHKPSEIVVDPNGRRVMIPPRDYVDFRPTVRSESVER